METLFQITKQFIFDNWEVIGTLIGAFLIRIFEKSYMKEKEIDNMEALIEKLGDEFPEIKNKIYNVLHKK